MDLVLQLPTQDLKDLIVDLTDVVAMQVKVVVKVITCQVAKKCQSLMEMASSKIFSIKCKKKKLLMKIFFSYAPGSAPSITNSNSISYV